MNIAVIGAGLSGLTVARQLQAQGHHITVYEKSADVSGRMASRQTELGAFDHGAQYMTGTSERFKKEIADWKKMGWITAWNPRLVTLEQGEAKPAGRSAHRYVAVPSMNGLGRQLAHGLDIRKEQRIVALEKWEGRWLLKLVSPEVAIPASAGPFDAVVLALPADQAFTLLAIAPKLQQQIRPVNMAPCWALMLGFQDSLELPFDAAWIQHSRLSWIARDTSKPGHRLGDRWILHATPGWSREHLEDDPERVRDKLSKAFHEATDSWVQPIYAVTHLWRFAQAEHPLEMDCLWNASLGIGICGDWFSNGLEGAGRIENAFLSGLALSKEIMS